MHHILHTSNHYGKMIIDYELCNYALNQYKSLDKLYKL